MIRVRNVLSREPDLLPGVGVDKDLLRYIGAASAAINLPRMTRKGETMPSSPPSASIPPAVARYLKGPIPESRQFAFLIGDWDVDANKFNPDGSVQFQYRAIWNARYLNEGRMVMDDFRTLGPNGHPVSSFVTLRTYSEESQRWEMAGLAAMQPAASLEWHGVWTGKEMQIDAAGPDPGSNPVRTKIRFHEITPERFLWESKSSADGGKTWIRTASLVANRAVAGAPGSA